MQLYRAEPFIRHLVQLVALCGYALLAGAWAPPAAPLVTREIQYQNAEAGAAALVWGVNGWQMVLPELRPPGTTTLEAPERTLMQTPMSVQNGRFVVQLQVPAGATINFIVHVLKTRSGVAVDAWDENLPARQFVAVADGDGTTLVEATSGLAEQSYTSPADVLSQMVGALVLAGLSLVLIVVAVRMHFKNPYLDF